MDLSALLTISDFEDLASTIFPNTIKEYVDGGAGSRQTISDNRAAFASRWLIPQILAETVDQPLTDVTILGQKMAMPVVLAPTSPQRLLHEEAELATARAAREAGTVAIVSSDSHYPFADVNRAGGGTCWFQVYAYGGQDQIARTVAMAEDEGAKALVITVDAHYPARRVSTLRAGFSTPPGVDFGTLRELGILEGAVPASARLERYAITWRDLAWIRGRSRLPLVVKGVLRAADARRCVDLGVDGIVVSNHGGRQLDSVVPSLTALARIGAEVGDECAVLLDGGVRSGVDVVKALALGADAVCIGRPYLWGLGLAGQRGVAAVLALLRQELDDTLRQLGVGNLADLDASYITSATAVH